MIRNLTASSLGLLTSTLLIAHAIAQIPLGLYLDSHGPKKVQITLLLLAAFGCIIFAISSNIYIMTFARLIIGIGSVSYTHLTLPTILLV